MKIQITPEMRIQLMHAETIEIDVPDAQTEFVGSLRQQLLTQDDRCTVDPFFVVFSKQEIVVDSEYDHDRIFWWHKEDHVEACERATRWLDYREDTWRDTGDWVKLAVKEIDQFETACFTEQGCKDYLAANGHNLRKPYIYANSLFRNWEMLELRKMLMADPSPSTACKAAILACADHFQEAWEHGFIDRPEQDMLDVTTAIRNFAESYQGAGS